MTRGADALADWLTGCCWTARILLPREFTYRFASFCPLLMKVADVRKAVVDILLRGNNNFLTFLATQRYIHTSIYRVRNSTTKYWNMHSWLQGERKSPTSKPCCLEVLLFVRNCVYFVWFMFVCLFVLFVNFSAVKHSGGSFLSLKTTQMMPSVKMGW